MAKKKADPAIPLEQAIPDEKVRRRFETLCTEYRRFCDQEDEAKAGKDALKGDIDILKRELGLGKVAGDGWEFVPSRGGRSDIVAERLLQKGVPMSVVQFATVKKEWDYFQVVRPK